MTGELIVTTEAGELEQGDTVVVNGVGSATVTAVEILYDQIHEPDGGTTSEEDMELRVTVNGHVYRLDRSEHVLTVRNPE